MNKLTTKVEIGTCALYLGNCNDILPTLEPVGVVVTDPPFNVGKDYGTHQDNLPPEEYEAWMIKTLNQCRALSAQNWWVVPTRKMQMFWRLMPTAQPVIIPMKAGYAVRSGWTQKFAAMLVEGTPPKNPWNLWEGIRHRGEGYFFREDTYEHPGYTPYPIMARAVETSGAEVVLDPFMGTGTTAIACIRNNKKFVGIELNPEYFEIAVKRIEDEMKQPSLDILTTNTSRLTELGSDGLKCALMDAPIKEGV